MTGKRTDNTHSKSDRALELFEKGLSTDQIAGRLGTSSRSVSTMLRTAKAKRERQMERLRALADAMGPNV